MHVCTILYCKITLKGIGGTRYAIQCLELFALD